MSSHSSSVAVGPQRSMARCIEFPHGIEHRVIVRVEDVLFELRVAGDMDLRNAFGRNAVDVVHWVEAVILRRDIDVVDVEQNPAVGRMDHLVQELPLGHLRFVVLGIAAYVFDSDGNLQEVLDLAHALRRSTHGFKRVRERQEIVGVAAVHAAPAKMIGEPRSFGALRQFLDSLQMVAVQRLCLAEVHRHAVLNDSVLIENLVENFEWAATIDHVVLGDDLEPIDHRLLRKDVVVMRHAQADADAIVGVSIETIGWHSIRSVDDDEKTREEVCGDQAPYTG